MCWNIHVSLGSAVFAWCTCVYLLARKKSPRDFWYASYLFTFTFTQVIDIALWSMHENGEYGLEACKNFQLQFGKVPESQTTNFYLSKFVVPLVVFSQHAVQCLYPSNRVSDAGRTKLIFFHLIPVAVMSFAFACTRVVRANFPVAHDTLFWGGDFEDWPFWMVQIGACAHSGLVAFVFTLVMPRKVCLVHNSVLACVVGTLLVTEGRMDLGSKWCTYCIIYSFVYIKDCFLTDEDSKATEAANGRTTKSD